MKPLYLKFAGIGPYVNKQEIDFEKLNLSKVFLISGATGSGKTYILDCIMQALYGESAGGVRNELQVLRCQFADKEVKTFVEFRLEVCGKIYEFHRSLRVIKKRDGSNEFDVDCDVFIIEDGIKKPIFDNPKKTVVNEKAIELIGLNAEQFRQVVILPQGKFESFLTSSTEDKTRILKTLFGTKVWEDIAVNLKNKFNHKKNLLREKSSGYENVLKNEDCNSIEQLDEQVCKFKERKKTLSNQLKNAEIELEKLRNEKQQMENLIAKFDSFDDKKEQLINLEKQKEQFESLKIELEKNNKALFLKSEFSVYENRLEIFKAEKIKYAESNENILKLEKELENLKQKVKDIKEQKTVFEEKKEYLSKIKSLEESYKTIDLVRSKVSESVNKFEMCETELKKLTDSILDIKKAQSKVEEDIFRVNNYSKNEYNNVLKIKESYDQFVGFKRTLVEKETERKTLCSEIENLNHELKISEYELDEATAEYDKLFGCLVDNVKQEIINSIAVGEICPVCGEVVKKEPNRKSVKHTDDFTILKHKHSILLDKTSKINENLMNKKNLLSTINLSIEEIRKIIDEQKQDFSDSNVAEMFEKEKVLKKEIDSIDQLFQTLNDNKVCLEEKQKLEERKRLESEELFKEKVSAQLNLENIEKSLEKNIPNLESLRGEISRISKEISQFDVNAEKIENEFNLKTASLTTENKYIEELKSKLIKIKSEIDEEKSKLESKALKVGFESFEDVKKFFIQEEPLKLKQEKYNAYLTEKSTLQTEIENLARELDKKIKPNLESLTNEIDLRIKSLNETRLDFGRTTEQLDRKQKLCFKLQKELSGIEDLSDECGFLSEFSDKINGIGCVSFQSYILSKYLTAVANEANRFLLYVENGRYSLCVDDEKVGGKRKIGLNLSVFDAYSSEKRGVHTLSGGEKFLVSLSLCLGLSAVVQAQNGGIRIETMFIDEGFGTLSSDALESSIKILTEIVSSKQIVGVISHVDKLKESLTTKIVVEKGTKGSNLRLQF